jgi:hypothetical protein
MPRDVPNAATQNGSITRMSKPILKITAWEVRFNSPEGLWDQAG